jgi:hypothetical protein
MNNAQDAVFWRRTGLRWNLAKPLKDVDRIGNIVKRRRLISGGKKRYGVSASVTPYLPRQPVPQSLRLVGQPVWLIVSA